MQVDSDSSTQASIHALRSILPLLNSTRSSLPTLLRTFASPSTSSSSTSPLTPTPPNPDLYRLRSSLVTKHIKDLHEVLLRADIKDAFERAEKSEREDGKGIVQVKVEEGIRAGAEEGWDSERFKEVLGTLKEGGGGDSDDLLKYTTPVDERTKTTTGWTRETLGAELDAWRERNKTKILLVRLEGVQRNTGMITMHVRGVMRCHLMLRLNSDSDRDDSTTPFITVERFSCFSLKEDKPSYQPSQYGLMQSITRRGMELIGICGGDLGRCLDFAKDPPVPF